jgi:hypothetical protein
MPPLSYPALSPPGPRSRDGLCVSAGDVRVGGGGRGDDGGSSKVSWGRLAQLGLADPRHVRTPTLVIYGEVRRAGLRGERLAAACEGRDLLLLARGEWCGPPGPRPGVRGEVLKHHVPRMADSAC